MSVREIVDKLCRDKGITRAFLEKELRMSNGTIGKWSNSKPSAENAKKVADYFGVSVEYILGDKEGIYDRIKSLCKSTNISIHTLEKALSFGNGTIARWDKNSPSVEKVKKVANYFNVSVTHILGEEKSPSNEEDRFKVIYNLLVDLGYVKPGEQISEEKLEILSSTIDNFVKLLDK